MLFCRVLGLLSTPVSLPPRLSFRNIAIASC
jgi:hypothetical protein